MSRIMCFSDLAGVHLPEPLHPLHGGLEAEDAPGRPRPVRGLHLAGLVVEAEQQHGGHLRVLRLDQAVQVHQLQQDNDPAQLDAFAVRQGRRRLRRHVLHRLLRLRPARIPAVRNSGTCKLCTVWRLISMSTYMQYA